MAGVERVCKKFSTFVQISIASVLQHEVPPDGTDVPLVIMTHETTEGAAAAACATIDGLACVRGKVVRMGVRD